MTPDTNKPETPPANPTATDELRRMFPADFQAALSAQGVEAEYATPVQFDLAASHVLRMHAAELFNEVHNAQLRSAGLAIDVANAPSAFVEKATRAGLSHRDIIEFAKDNYDGWGDPLKMLQADLAKAKKHAEQPDDPNRSYGEPF